jgi:hypothetical protein
MTVEEQRHDNDLWPIAETQEQQRRDAYMERWAELVAYFQKPITAADLDEGKQPPRSARLRKHIFGDSEHG